MKKIKKYVYPYIFSAIFLILYITLAFILTKVISFPNGSYAPAALAVLFTFVWILIVLPIYCVKYSKIIVNERLNFFFVIYNFLILAIIHVLPFNLQNEKRIVIDFLIWVSVWCVVPLVIRLIHRKRKEKATTEETS